VAVAGVAVEPSSAALSATSYGAASVVAASATRVKENEGQGWTRGERIRGQCVPVEAGRALAATGASVATGAVVAAASLCEGSKTPVSADFSLTQSSSQRKAETAG
jgi:hypothetical protein